MNIYNMLSNMQANIDYAKPLASIFAEYMFNDTVERYNFIIQFAIKSNNFYFVSERFDIDKLQNTFNCIDSNKAKHLIFKNNDDIIRVFLKKYGTEKEQERFLYRERGITRLFGKENYKKYGELLAIDLLKHPNLSLNKYTSCRIALEFWQANKCDKKTGNIEELIKTVHGECNEEYIKKTRTLMTLLKIY